MKSNTILRPPKAGNGKLLLPVVLALFLLYPASLFAQGSVFGTVQNADLSTPANGEISFFGFLDSTDEEIHIETCDGAGYDAGNWFDDFQNYLSRVPGNPYDYFFVNVTNGQAHHLAKLIPNNSFQQENIVLSAASLPAAPVNLTARALSTSRMLVTWSGTPGLTYHVYRRVDPSNGSLFRIDSPSGSLSNHGVSDTFFVDATTNGVSSYTYVIIAENGSGLYSPHSATATGNSATLFAPTVTSVVPATGATLGGTLVHIYGTGFDAAGVTVAFGASNATSVTVVSPQHITARTPAGSGTVNVTVTNNASTLSGVLTNGFTYTVNTTPVANAGPNQLGQFKYIAVTLDGSGSSDADGDSLAYHWRQVAGPVTVSFPDSTKVKPTFTPTANGDYVFELQVSDPYVTSVPDSVRIQVVERAPVLAAIGPQSVNEGGNLNFGTSATDPDGTIPVMTAVNVPANATYTNNGNGTGTFNFNPDYTQAGVYNVTFIASDGVLADSEIVAITVNNVNRPPVLAAIGPKSVNEGANLNFNISASDPDATTPLLTALNLPPNATFVDSGNGRGNFNFDPNYTQSGIYNVTFIASDGSLADSEVVTITVTEFNRPPVLAAIGPKSVNEGANLNFNISASDPDATTPLLTALNLPANATFVDSGNGRGNFNFDPDYTQSGLYNVTFIASDGSLADSEAVAITVNNVNRAPVLAAIGPKSVNEGANLNFNTSATDPDGTPLTLTAVGLPTNATYVDSGTGTGNFNFDPDYTQSGLYNVTFIASDGSLADSEVVAVTVTEFNRPPVLAAIGPKSVNEGANLNFNISASDPDATIPLLTALNLPPNATFADSGNGRGNFNFDPDYTQSGLYNVTFIASDGSLADSEVVAITVNNVNRAPVLAAIGPKSVNEGANLNFNTSATDPDGTPLTLMAVGLPTNATCVDSGNGVANFNFDPDYTQSGLYSVTFIASDGSLADSEVVAITVTDVNRAPILATIGPKLVNEGSNLNFNASAVDPDGVIPTLSALNLPANTSFVDSGNGTGNFDFDPDYTQEGIYNVTFIASDGVLADSEVVTITVNDAGNQSPVLASIGPKSVAEGANLNFNISAADPDATIPLLSAIGLPANAAFVDSGNGRGNLDFNPDYTQAGVYNVTFIASDGLLADSEIVAITVTDFNRSPVLAYIGPRSVNAGSNLSFNTSATDADGTVPIMTAVNLPTHATYVDHSNGTGTFDFYPDMTQSGVYNVTFIASDGSLADSEVVPITVINTANLPPVVDLIGPKTAYEGGVLTVLVHATDDGGVPHLLFSAAALMHYSFVDSGNGYGTLVYSPDYYDAGVDTVTFIAQDLGNPPISALEKVVITTIDVNQPPVIAHLTDVTLLPGDSLKMRVVAYDSTDAANGPLYLIALAKPAGSVFTDSTGGRGSLRWKATIADTGVHSFIVMCLDNGSPALSAVDTARITVLRANQPPVLAPVGPKSVLEGDTLLVHLTATDPDGTIPYFYAQNMPTNSALYDSGNGSALFTFTPDFQQAGLYSPKFYASDGNKVDYEVVMVQVTDVPQPPVLDVPVDTQSVKEGDSLQFTISVTDADGTTDTLKIDPATLPINATFVDSANGRGLFKFKPVYVQAGLYDIRFLATDGILADTAVVQVLVIEAGNQNPKITVTPTSVTVNEGQQITIRVSAVDADSSIPVLSTSTPLPFTAAFTDSLNGKGVFYWKTEQLQTGSYTIRFYATDADTAGVADSLDVPITVRDINIPPGPLLYDPLSICYSPGSGTCAGSVPEGGTMQFRIYSAPPDSDATHPFLRAKRFTNVGTDTTFALLPTNMSLTDHRDDSATFLFTPGYNQHGSYKIMFFVIDETDSLLYTGYVYTVNCTDVSVPPVLDSIGPQSVLEGGLLEFFAAGEDPDGTPVTLSATGMPPGATFTAQAGQPVGTAKSRFLYAPSFTAAGTYTTTFKLTETSTLVVDSEVVTITVIEAGNQKPVIVKFDTLKTVNVTNDSALFWLRSTDPDGTRPSLSLSGTPFVPWNAVFYDSGNGRGRFVWNPVDNQKDSSFILRFIASDGVLADTARVRVLAIAGIRGDADNSGSIDVSDVVFLINFIFGSGPAPVTVRHGNADGSGTPIDAPGSVDISDAVYLVNYIFASGPPPPPL